MKIVINACFGGFSLSALAVKRLAELQGSPCFFFDFKGDPLTLEEASDNSFFLAGRTSKSFETPANWHELTDAQKAASNKRYEKWSISTRPDDRRDPLLVQVVEDLKDKASGSCAKLKIIDIPDGVKYEIDEYDGNESVHEIHQSWS